MSLFRRCPSERKLTEFVESGAPRRVAQHLEKCPACRDACERMRKDERLLSELRAALDAGLDHAEREKILRLCDRSSD